MVICADFEASVFFLLLDVFRVQLILHAVKDDSAVALILFLGLCDEVANFRLDQCETVIEPGFDEVCKLEVLDIRVLDNIFAFDKIFACG